MARDTTSKDATHADNPAAEAAEAALERERGHDNNSDDEVRREPEPESEPSQSETRHSQSPPPQSQPEGKAATSEARAGPEARDTQTSKPSMQETDPNTATPPSDDHEEGEIPSDPPLPNELPPPLPSEPVPGTSAPLSSSDDGWEPVWDPTAQAYYFYNRHTSLSQWENPRVPTDPNPTTQPPSEPSTRPHGGYNPAIHGDYDPSAPYALEASASASDPSSTNLPNPSSSSADEAAAYAATGQFNRFTGRWQAAELGPGNYSDEAKSRRQMGAFFDVDAAANSHQGKSLRAERAGMKLSRQELRAFKEKRREKKEEKRRAWLRD